MIARSRCVRRSRARLVSLLVVVSLMATVAPIPAVSSAGPADAPDWAGDPGSLDGRFGIVGPEPNPAVESARGAAASGGGAAEADSVIVRFRDDLRPGAAGRARAHERSGGRAPQPLRFARGFEVAEVPPGVTAEELAARYAAEPGVLHAEPNITVELASDFEPTLAPAPNDTFFNRLWALRNDGQRGGLPGADIGLLEAWQATRGSDEVVVAVIDTGVDYTHVDLASRMWSGLGYDFYSDDDDPIDVHGHGTHVASTIAAAADDGFGVAGVAPEVRIMALRVFNDSGTGATIAMIVNAFGFAEANGADIVNASWVVGTDSPSLRTAVTGSSALVVAAAGNHGTNNDSIPYYPAAWNDGNVLAVAATDRFDQRATFSNWGPSTVDIAAPGVDILGAVPGRETVHFHDDFSDMDAWVAQYSASNDWGLSDEHFTSSPFALADSPGGPYADNEDSFVRMLDPVDLAGASAPRLEFEMWLDTETGFDGVAVFAQDGSGWSYLGSWSGSTGGEFDLFQVDLAAYAGKQVRIGFLFGSDASLAGQGAFIDDLRVVSSAPAGSSNRHGYKNGTSMAAPHAAGVAALLLSSAPELSAAQAKELLRNWAAPLPALAGKVATGSRLDTRMLLSAPPAVTGLTSPSHGDTASWTTVTDVEFRWDAVEHPVGISGYVSGLLDDPDEEPVDGVAGATGASFPGVASGEWHFAVRARTLSGVVGPVMRSTVRIDTIPPVTSSDVVPSYVGSAPIELSAADEHSGVLATYYSLNGAPSQQYGGTLVVDGPAEIAQYLSYWSVDHVGNTESATTVRFAIDDTTPPVTALELEPADPDGASGWYRTMPLITMTADDSGSGVAYIEWRFEDQAEWTQGGEVTGFGDGEHTLHYRSVDHAGNVEESRSVEFKVDTTPPVTLSDAVPSYDTSATITLEATDGRSGVAATYYTVNGGPARTYTQPLTFDEPDVVHTLSFWSVDRAGNIETPTTVSFAVDDTTPPVTALELDPTDPDGASGWYRTMPLITMTADDSGSGVAYSEWRFEGQAEWTRGSEVTGFGDGEHILHYRSVDHAGNVEESRSVEFKVDTTPPVTALELDPTDPDGASGWYRTMPLITMTADDSGSGVAYSEWRFEGQAEWTRGSEVTGFGDGEHILHYRSVDHAGNVEESRSVEFKVDTSAPTVRHTGGGTFADPTTLTIQASDATSGVREIFWTGDRSGSAPGDAVSLKFTDPGTYSIVYWATDRAGNISTMGSATVTIRATDVARLAGSDRYATSVAIAREAYPRFAGVKYVVIASGEDRAAADPLAAAGLAGVLDAPLLLVHSGGVPDPVRAAIASMPDEVTVVIIGGTAAVPSSVGRELSAIRRVGDVQRVEGPDRYATARAIAARMRTELQRQGKPMSDTALLANGADQRAFFDALALSAVSAENHFPILLLERDRVPAATAAALRDNGLTMRVIGGGPAVVSERVRSQLGAERWAGPDRYATAAAIASRATAAGYSTYGTTAVAASLPDALTGGAMAGSRGGVLLLTQRDRLTPVTGDTIRSQRMRVTHIYVLGGSASVTEPVRTRIRTLIQ